MQARMKRTRMKRMSTKRRKLLPERRALLLGLGDLVGWRCEYPPCSWRGHLEGHEIKKPRAKYWLNPEYVIMLCAIDHVRAEVAYNAKEGRLVIGGTRSTGWTFTEASAASKFAWRVSLVKRLPSSVG